MNRRRFEPPARELGPYFEGWPEQKLTYEEEVELGRKALAGDTDARNAMVTANLALAVWVAKRFALKDRSLSLSDLVQAGNLGLLKAATKFDPDEFPGVRFGTYATRWVFQNIQREVHCRSRVIYIPFHVKKGDGPQQADIPDFAYENLPDDGSDSLPNRAIRNEEIAAAKATVARGLDILPPAWASIVSAYHGIGGCFPANLSRQAEAVGASPQSIGHKYRSAMKRLGDWRQMWAAEGRHPA